MAIAVQEIVRIMFVPDGVGAMEVPSAQVVSFTSPIQIVAGGNVATFANVSAALDNVDTLLQPQITAALGQINGWATGGP